MEVVYTTKTVVLTTLTFTEAEGRWLKETLQNQPTVTPNETLRNAIITAFNKPVPAAAYPRERG